MTLLAKSGGKMDVEEIRKEYEDDLRALCARPYLKDDPDWRDQIVILTLLSEITRLKEENYTLKHLRDELFERVDNSKAEVVGLRGLIREHRKAIWGTGKVEHPYDKELYALAEGSKEGGKGIN
jgi:hypothetical protein